MNSFFDYSLMNRIANHRYGNPAQRDYNIFPSDLDIKKVIFNNPATIVYWTDGVKTVVKVNEEESFDKEKGIAMAVAKRFFGGKGNYYDHIKPWLEEE